MSGGYALGSAFDSKAGQMIMAALLLMAASFYLGTIFGNNEPIYISQNSANSSSLSSSRKQFLPFSDFGFFSYLVLLLMLNLVLVQL